MSGLHHQNRATTARSRTGLTALLFATLALPGALLAQDLTLVPAQDRAATMRLVTARTGSAIEADLDNAREMGAALQREAERLSLALAEAKAAVDVKESEIDVIKTRKDLADKQDNEAQKKTYEQQEDDEEDQKRLLERHVTLIERQIDLVRAQRETSSSAERVYQEELKLERLSSDLEELQETDSGTLSRAMQLQAEFSTVEKDVLEAQRDLARRKEQEAQRERRVVEARLEIVEAREQIRTS